MRMGLVADTVIARHRKRLRRVKHITVELDPTDDPTHGAQQLSFFNGHYDTIYHGGIRPDDEPEQYLFAYGLAMRTRSSGRLGYFGAFSNGWAGGFPRPRCWFVSTGVCRLRCSNFSRRSEWTMWWLAENAVLKRIAEPLMKKVRMSKKSGETEHLYGECRYAAGSWNRERRVIFKAEVVRLGHRAPKDNARFVVTNLRRVPAGVRSGLLPAGEH